VPPTPPPAANEEFALIHGGRHAVPPAAFANEVVSGEINLEQDYRRWARDRAVIERERARGGAGELSASDANSRGWVG
jgi:hypothetical protein